MSKAVKQTRPKAFTGILAQPFDKPDDLVIALLAIRQPETVKKAIYQAVHEYVHQQRWERLVALAERYEVDLQRRTPDPILELLFLLAADFVPGFRPSKDSRTSRVGKPSGRNHEQNFELFGSVEILMHRKGVSALSACHIISKDRKSSWHGFRPKALYERYTRFKGWLEIIPKGCGEHPLYSRIAEIKRSRSQPT